MSNIQIQRDQPQAKYMLFDVDLKMLHAAASRYVE